MKIAPPEAPIDAADPFKSDLFGRKEFALSLKKIVERSEDSFVIFINAPWGEGKTTFCKMWKALLQLEKKDAIYFDAFAADYFDDPFVSFSGEIVDFLRKRYPDDDQLSLTRKKFSEAAVTVAKKLAGTAAKALLKLGTMNALETSDLVVMKGAVEDLATGMSEAGEDFIKSRIEDYAKERNSLASFKKDLTKVAEGVRRVQNFPLTIIVDELDRCRPEYALKLLERVKHLFDVPNVIFILLINREQLESYTRAVLGESVKAADYLQKFGHIVTDLPKSELRARAKESLSFCVTLSTHYQIPDRRRTGNLTFADCVARLAEHFGMSMRDMQRVYAIASIYFAAIPDNIVADPFLVAFLTILKVKRPSLYRRLADGDIDLPTFHDESRMHYLADNGLYPKVDWIKNLFQYCLQSEDDFARLSPEMRMRVAGDAQAVLGDLNIRKKLIPYYCRSLDQFRRNPE